MRKKILLIILSLLCSLMPAASLSVFAAESPADSAGDSAAALSSDSVETALPKLTEYELSDIGIRIMLPESWYCNTPDKIDKDFLEVSENSARKLKKYLTKQNVKYNMLSKDLSQEINVILMHDSKSKLLFNYNEMDPEKLKSQAQALIDSGSQENKAGVSTFSEYSVEENNGCTFVCLKGDMSDENQQARVIQYSTVVNGYGVNFSIKCYDADLYEESEALIREAAKSFKVDEIQAANFEQAVFTQVVFPAALLLLFIATTIFLFIRQIRKNKREEREAAAAKAAAASDET